MSSSPPSGGLAGQVGWWNNTLGSDGSTALNPKPIHAYFSNSQLTEMTLFTISDVHANIG